jgi:hypothetical protein
MGGLYCIRESGSPNRIVGSLARLLCGASDGLHESGRADERARTCLLPDDEGPMRRDGDARFSWVLP